MSPAPSPTPIRGAGCVERDEGGTAHSRLPPGGQYRWTDVGEMALGLVEWIGAAPPRHRRGQPDRHDRCQGTRTTTRQFYAAGAASVQAARSVPRHGPSSCSTMSLVVSGPPARRPLTMNSLLFAGEREARHVWGVYNNGADTLHIQVLKPTRRTRRPQRLPGDSAPLVPPYGALGEPARHDGDAGTLVRV